MARTLCALALAAAALVSPAASASAAPVVSVASAAPAGARHHMSSGSASGSWTADDPSQRYVARGPISAICDLWPWACDPG